jgi:threonine-phosphate decarboxylase
LICNPNNPTGEVLSIADIDELAKKYHLVVIDQSYEDYTKESLIEPKEVMKCRNLLVLHSLSKRFAIPGLRIGYVTGHPDTIALLRSQSHPWSVSALAIEAGKFLLRRNEPVIPDLTDYLQETERLRTNLRKIEGIRVYSTKTNFMLCDIEPATSTKLKFYLVQEHGILIRDCANFMGLSDHFFRVATQRPEENDILVDAIRQFISEIPENTL